MDTAQKMYTHFSRVAPRYRQVRITDAEPVDFIRETLRDLPEIKAADVGCGDGRYDLLLFRYIKNLYLICVDINESMLKRASDYLRSHGIANFSTLRADAGIFSSEDHSLDCIFSFNAVHHFDFIRFVKNCSRAIKENGRIFIYTRLRSQNSGSIWGKYFPLFQEKETRLFEVHEIRQMLKSLPSLKLEHVKTFRFRRNTTMKHLAEKVRARHYSTFSLYKDGELEEALETFRQTIGRQFRDINNIEWFDENTLFILKPA